MAGQSHLKSSTSSSPSGEGVAQRTPDPSGGAGNAALAARIRAEIEAASQTDADDDLVRDTIGAPHLAIATAEQKALMIVALLDGATGDEDEAKILEILRSQSTHATFDAVEKMGHLEWLFDDVNGAEHDELQELYDGVQAQAAAEDATKAAEAPTAEEAPSPAPTAAPEIAEPQQVTDPADPRLSEHRKSLLAEGEKRMDSRIEKVVEIPDPKDPTKKIRVYKGTKMAEGKVNLFDGTQETKAGATSCGLLPGVLLGKLGLDKNPKTFAMTRWITSNGKDAPGMEKYAREAKAWIEATGKNKPQPGDIYVNNYLGGAFAHIGVIRRIGDTAWETMDSGQGRGLQDLATIGTKYLVTDAQKAEYNGDPTNQHDLGEGTYFVSYGSTPDTVGKDPRKLHGWVDLDKLMDYAAGKTLPAK